MTELLLIRHALPITAGLDDPGLAPEGRAQAARLADWLAREGVGAIVASPHARARETAAPTAAALGLVPVVLDDLREWEPSDPRPYVAIEDMAAEDPQLTALVDGRYEDFPPAMDGEGIRIRAARALEEICGRWPGETVAVVSHGGLINVMVAGVLGLEQMFWFVPDYTSVTRLVRMGSGRTVVRSVNELPHGEARRRLGGAAQGPDLVGGGDRRRG